MLTKLSRLSLVFTTSLAFVLIGCNPSKSPEVSEITGEGRSQLWSSRSQQKPTQFWAIVRLTGAPLTAIMDPSNVQASYRSFASEANALIAEQDLFIKTAQRIDPRVQLVQRFKWSLNAVLITGPIEALVQIEKISLVTAADTDGTIERPAAVTTRSVQAWSQKFAKNSVAFTGAEKLRQGDQPIDGTGVRVGVLDTGIDYTHKMFGGPGDKGLIKKIDPALPNEFFPNKRVVGGIDIVGSDFNTRSSDIQKRIPKSDPNPIDEATHGTHVAGTIAGLGDGENFYTGMAPGAELYAIKVFGKEGSTNDSAVILGFEHAMDPNGDLNPEDHLHVLNLSLGSNYGSSRTLYNEAIQQLSRIGMIVVASAGNSGDISFITGSPGATDGAFSVAANIDDSDENWKTPSSLILVNGQPTFVDRVIGEVGTAITTELSQPIDLVDMGYADQPASPELAEKVKGKIAFIYRGKVSFAQKFANAQNAGAIAAVVMNDRPGAPFTMGGEPKAKIPGIMVTQEMGQKILAALAIGAPAQTQLFNEKINEYPEKISQITDFSSRGPRADGLAIKPQITAPGENILSALSGGGTEAVRMSGTSMAGPHVAGAMALLRSVFPTRSAEDLQAIVMNQADPIRKANNSFEAIARQGAGQLRVDRAAAAKVIAKPAGLALGRVTVEGRKVIRRTLSVENISGREQTVLVQLEQAPRHLWLRQDPQPIKIAADRTAEINIDLVVGKPEGNASVTETDAWLKIVSLDETLLARVPLLAYVQKISSLGQNNVEIFAGAADQAFALGRLTLENTSANAAEVLPFNFLASDTRKTFGNEAPLIFSNQCDLQAVGYRLTNNNTTLQLAAKMYRPISSWNFCEVTVLIDSNEDGIPEQELAAVELSNVPGLSPRASPRAYANVLFDASKMRAIRKKADEAAKADPEQASAPNFAQAVLAASPLQVFDHTSIVVLEAPVKDLQVSRSGELRVQVIAQNYDGYDLEYDDFLGLSSEWLALSLQANSQGFLGLPAKIEVAGNTKASFEFTRGEGLHDLMLLHPTGSGTESNVLLDNQVLIPKTVFSPFPKDN